MKHLLFLALLSPLHAQTWVKVVPEAMGNTAMLPASTTYRFGIGTTWCDPVTTVGTTTLTVWWSNIICKVKGVTVADPAVGVQKELDVAQGAIAMSIPVMIAGMKSTVSVPVLPSVGPTVIATYTCICKLYSDATFTCTPVTP